MTLPRLDTKAIVALRPWVQRPTPGNLPHKVLREREPFGSPGIIANALTVFLRGSECSFRCLMCDLWKSTHFGPTPEGSIVSQVESALTELSLAEQASHWIKLYNASNFFSPINVPAADLPRIARLVSGFERVVVENHPRILPRSIEAFRDAIAGRLEIGLGLETVHPEILAALNKQMSLEDFTAGCRWLLARDIDLRAFVLLRPPGLNEAEGIQWCHRSIRFAQELGVRHVSVIPVRSGNGAIEQLQRDGHFQSPLASSLEAVIDEQLGNGEFTVTADLWDWHKLRGLCPKCSEPRRLRIEALQLTRQFQSRIPCDCASPP